METWDDVAAWLRERRAAQGLPSYRTLLRRVRELRVARGQSPQEVPGRATIYDCFRDGRRRMDLELLADLGRALGLDEEEVREWEASCFAVQNRIESARVVRVTEQVHHTPYFVGRTSELRALAEPGVWLISGMPGVGKTQLALQAAQRWIHQGVGRRILVADLRGFDPGRVPADGAALVDELLRTLTGQPVGPPRRRAELATRLAAEEVVLVLDDAAGVDQIEEIVDTGIATPILITSRLQLPVKDTRALPLSPLDTGDGVRLLTRILGDDSVEDEPVAAAGIVTRLGGLPLAIDVTAQRIASVAGWTLADHAEALARQAALLRSPEPLAPAFELSYQRLSRPARLILRLLADQPCPSLPVAALVAMADLDVLGAVSELAASSLVTHANGRLWLHDLVRVLGAAAAVDEDRPTDRDRARGILLDYYLDAAGRAVVAARLAPRLSPDRIPEIAVGDLTAAEAVAWLDTERENLLTLADPRQCRVRPGYTATLSEILSRALEVQGHYQGALTLHGQALELARLAGDQQAQARALAFLGQVLARIDGARAVAPLHRALALVDPQSDPDTEVSAVNALAIVAWQQGEYGEARRWLERALDTVQTRPTTRTAAGILGNLGVVAVHLGDLDAGADYHRRAQLAAEAAGEDEVANTALSNLASVELERGCPEAAEEAAIRAVATARRLGAHTSKLSALVNLGVARTRCGRPGEAAEPLQEVHRIARECSDTWHQAGAAVALAEMHLAGGEPEPARVWADQARALATEAGYQHWQDQAEALLERIG